MTSDTHPKRMTLKSAIAGLAGLALVAAVGIPTAFADTTPSGTAAPTEPFPGFNKMITPTATSASEIQACIDAPLGSAFVVQAQIEANGRVDVLITAPTLGSRFAAASILPSGAGIVTRGHLSDNSGHYTIDYLASNNSPNPDDQSIFQTVRICMQQAGLKIPQPASPAP